MIYFMRHGQTDWNIDYRLQGQTDIPLNENGREMAIAASEQYRDTHIDLCYVSPLSRAVETAELFLAGRNIPIIKDERLMEMNFGQYEGRMTIFKHPEWSVYKLFKDPLHYRPDLGAETFEELYERTGSFLNDRIKSSLDQDILIVGHGALCLALVNQLLEVPLSNYWDHFLQNCQLMPVEEPSFDHIGYPIKR